MSRENSQNNLPNNAEFCNTDGVLVGENKSLVDIEYFSISLWRLALFSILTFGFYQVYWFYRNWNVIKKAEQQEISPFWRAVFAVFFCYSLFKKIAQSAGKRGYIEIIYPSLLAVIYIGLYVVGYVLGEGEAMNFGLSTLCIILILATFIPLLPIQKAINFNNSKVVENYIKTKTFIIGEVIFIVIGIMFWLILIQGIFLNLKDHYKLSAKDVSQVRVASYLINLSPKSRYFK